jgi:hypothetical protein
VFFYVWDPKQKVELQFTEMAEDLVSGVKVAAVVSIATSKVCR